jgi:periplasmic protein TonB
MPIMEVHEEAVAAPPAPAALVQPSAPEFIEYKPLFADALLENQWRGTQRRRGWSTAISFIVQAILLSVVVILPLMYTDVLPRQQLMTYLVAPPPPPPPPPPAATEQIQRTVRSVETEIVNGQLRTPAKIPERVKMLKEEEAPPPIGNGGVVGGVPGGIPGGQVGGVIGGIISDTAKVPILPRLPKPAIPQRVRVSQGVSAGMLVHQIKPDYPPLARAARIQGQVVLSAVIGKDGAIQNLQVISGHPMLVPAAVQAVQKWLYRPYLLNGEPVEVVTQVLVTFTLSAE